jgi:outer membrane protein assembly factor BamB
MHMETTAAAPEAADKQAAADVAKPPRLWPAVALVATFWGLQFIVGRLDKAYFVGFLFSMAAAASLVLLFFAWWWTNRRVPFRERLLAFGLVLGLGVAVAPFCHPSMWFALPTLGLPVVLTVWTLWMLLVKQTGISWNRRGLLVVVALAWGWFALVRMDGADGALRADTRWRWSAGAEDLFLAEKARRSAPRSQPRPVADSPLIAAPGDWTEFRGPDRDGVIRGVTIAGDWDTAPPRQLWRQRVGPAWSSVLVIGDRLFTQEQRDQQEAVVCYRAATGEELWVHEDRARFWEAVSGAGPRATPTFADGRLYTLGATGILNCLDAATGKQYWSRDITALADSKPPLWGYSGSPLVTDGVVVVFAGGPGDRGLLALRTDSGETAWTAAAGQGSYSSPQAATIAGKRQCLFLGDRGLTAVDPATGSVLWQHGLAMPGAPRTAQAHALGDGRLVVGSLAGPGVVRIEVSRDGDAWKAAQVWATTQLKPEFPDLVVHQGHAYGLDVGILCCIDLATGKRCWRDGRYGRGQIMVLADQGVLLVLSETGEAVLVAADPRRHEVRGRFAALDGKTWNHPVIAHGRLYVRNAEEMACYKLDAR